MSAGRRPQKIVIARRTVVSVAINVGTVFVHMGGGATANVLDPPPFSGTPSTSTPAQRPNLGPGNMVKRNATSVYVYGRLSRTNGHFINGVDIGRGVNTVLPDPTCRNRQIVEGMHPDAVAAIEQATSTKRTREEGTGASASASAAAIVSGIEELSDTNSGDGVLCETPPKRARVDTVDTPSTLPAPESPPALETPSAPATPLAPETPPTPETPIEHSDTTTPKTTTTPRPLTVREQLEIMRDDQHADTEQDECIVCANNKRCVKLSCGDIQTCVACTMDLVDEADAVGPACIVCRKSFTTVTCVSV